MRQLLAILNGLELRDETCFRGPQQVMPSLHADISRDAFSIWSVARMAARRFPPGRALMASALSQSPEPANSLPGANLGGGLPGENRARGRRQPASYNVDGVCLILHASLAQDYKAKQKGALRPQAPRSTSSRDRRCLEASQSRKNTRRWLADLHIEAVRLAVSPPLGRADHTPHAGPLARAVVAAAAHNRPFHGTKSLKVSDATSPSPPGKSRDARLPSVLRVRPSASHHAQ